MAKNGKKALSCVMAQDSPYKDYVKTGNLPSGMNHDDYLQFVCEKMFALLNPPKQGQDANDLNLLDNGAEGTTSTSNSSSMEIDADAGKMFTFAGYIVFALMGPIVENFDMLHYRSDLLMRSTPAYSSTAEKKLAGRSNSRAQQSNMKRKHRRDSDDATNDNGSILTRSSASDVVDLSVATLSECIQAAGIAQSRLAERGKKKAKVNDRKIAMHLKKATGKQSMIQEQKFLISATAPEDPNRQLYLLERRTLQQDLAAAIEDLTSAEERIIEDEVADAAKLNNVDVMIENTLTSILDKKNNHERINETRVSPMPPAFAGASNMNDFDDNIME